jgi:hypothetical protein
MAFDSTPDYAWSVVQGIYRDITTSRGYNFTAGADEQNDLNNRIRNGQSMAEITANTYDDANRRFPIQSAPDTSRDAQLEIGRQYEPPPQLVQSVVAAAPPPPLAQVAAVGPGALTSDLSSGPGGPIGVSSPRAGGGSTRYSSTPGAVNVGMGGGIFGFDTTTLLIVGAVGVGAWFLLKKK